MFFFFGLFCFEVSIEASAKKKKKSISIITSLFIPFLLHLINFISLFANVSVFVQKTNKQTIRHEQSLCSGSVSARTESLFRLSGANIKYLLYFCKMSLNGSLFFKGGREQVLQCGSDAVTHITCSTRLFWSSSFLVSCFVFFCFLFFFLFTAGAVCRAWG